MEKTSIKTILNCFYPRFPVRWLSLLAKETARRRRSGRCEHMLSICEEAHLGHSSPWKSRTFRVFGKSTSHSPLHLFPDLMDLNLRQYRSFDRLALFWYNIDRRKESEVQTMKTTVRRLKPTLITRKSVIKVALFYSCRNFISPIG